MRIHVESEVAQGGSSSARASLLWWLAAAAAIATINRRTGVAIVRVMGVDTSWIATSFAEMQIISSNAVFAS